MGEEALDFAGKKSVDFFLGVVLGGELSRKNSGWTPSVHHLMGHEKIFVFNYD